MCCVYSQDPPWRTFIDGNTVTAIAVEEESVWIGFEYSGLAYLENPDGSLVYYNTDNSDLPVNKIKSIAIDTDGIKWIGSRGSGLVKLEGENG